MQRVLSLKLLTKNLSNKTTSISSNAFLSPPKSPNTPVQHQQFFSQYTTWSCRPQNRAFSDKIPTGLHSNPILARQFLQNNILKGQSKNLFDGPVEFLRVQFSRRNFHSNFSFDSKHRAWQYRFRRLTTDGVVLGLILTNVAVFILWHVADREFMRKHFMISLDNFQSGWLHTLITSAFSHIDIEHLISNMIGLYFFGTSMGRVFGPEYLLKLYLAGALVGSVFFLVHHAFIAPTLERKRMGIIDPSKVSGLGASGAVNAIMLLDIFLFPKKTLYFDFIIPVPAILLGIFLVGKDVLRILEGDSQISGSAHLGGATVAALAWLQLRRGRSGFRF